MSPKRLVVAGGTGFLGSVLRRFFTAQGWSVVVLTRQPRPRSLPGREVAWDGAHPGPWGRELEGADAVINLAGHSVNCRYHARNRRRILESRILPTQALGEAIAGCACPPQVWLNASTATIYRHTLGPPWDESGALGGTPEVRDEFSVEVAQAWETALACAEVRATRKVALRTAMVLGHGRNSVFPVLCRLVRLGLGGRMGSGQQYVSWIHQTDFCRALDWLTRTETVDGAVNLAAPNPVRQEELMRTLRRLCGRRWGMPATQWMLELGAWALRTETELIMKSRRVVPGRLLESGFTFEFPEVEGAMKDLLVGGAT